MTLSSIWSVTGSLGKLSPMCLVNLQSVTGIAFLLTLLRVTLWSRYFNSHWKQSKCFCLSWVPLWIIILSLAHKIAVFCVFGVLWGLSVHYWGWYLSWGISALIIWVSYLQEAWLIHFFPEIYFCLYLVLSLLIKSLEWSQNLSVCCMNNFSRSSVSDKDACVIWEDLLAT